MLKVVLTGHSQGLGAALAAALLDRCVPVLALSRSKNAALAACHAHLAEVRLDLADSEALARWLAGGTLARFLAGAGRAWLVNNAGTLTPQAQAGAQGAALLARAVALNVAAPMMLADAFVGATAALADRRVLHVGSGAGRQPYPGWSMYCASKAALDMHARTLAAENHAGLRIASVAPGVIDTAMQAQIRRTTPGDFPARERFVALKDTGALTSPGAAAAKVLAYLESGAFGEAPLADVRSLPAG
ncbi:SDR family oxidoreductase [Crenobacter intestini]|uniref:SDR family oxidoreductase n=1 Tax=Crenobacter intestini TaxID=2563443 RepID=A0A4T0UWT9_9NEIS|nr:SDR family oxidoreductase [Crenobacter intestini]TIC83145.1 SDR family oxidoreductase [Crenobacter intestini]